MNSELDYKTLEGKMFFVFGFLDPVFSSGAYKFYYATN
jgi:hypothetical protein